VAKADAARILEEALSLAADQRARIAHELIEKCSDLSGRSASCCGTRVCSHKAFFTGRAVGLCASFGRGRAGVFSLRLRAGGEIT